MPTFEDSADLLVDYDPAMMRAKLVDMTNFGNTDETYALELARKQNSRDRTRSYEQIFNRTYWEASNIKTAAIVRSKKYKFVDDYEYITIYDDPLNLDTGDRIKNLRAN